MKELYNHWKKHDLEPLYGYLLSSISSRFFPEIVYYSSKSSLDINSDQKCFCAVALLVFEKHFHFGSDTNDCQERMN